MFYLVASNLRYYSIFVPQSISLKAFYSPQNISYHSVLLFWVFFIQRILLSRGFSFQCTSFPEDFLFSVLPIMKWILLTIYSFQSIFYLVFFLEASSRETICSIHIHVDASVIRSSTKSFIKSTKLLWRTSSSFQ